MKDRFASLWQTAGMKVLLSIVSTMVAWAGAAQQPPPDKVPGVVIDHIPASTGV